MEEILDQIEGIAKSLYALEDAIRKGLARQENNEFADMVEAGRELNMKGHPDSSLATGVWGPIHWYKAEYHCPNCGCVLSGPSLKRVGVE